MKINLTIFLSFFSLLSSIKYLESPFNLKFLNQDENKTIDSFKNIYIDIEASFGSNKETFNLALDLSSIAMVIPDIKSDINKNDIKKFNISSSNTFHIIHTFNPAEVAGERFYTGIEGEDYIKFGKDIINIRFVVANSFSFSHSFLTPNYAFFGLKIPLNSSAIKIHNTIEELKNKNLISHEVWYLNFNSENSGTFVIGALPEEIDDKTFPENKRQKVPFSNYNDIFQMKFDEIYYGKIEEYDKRKTTENKGVLFSLSSRLIECTNDYWAIISQFFDKKRQENICVSPYNEDNVVYYYCYKDKFNMSEMENVNFHIRNINYTFVFEPKDLFYEKDGILYYLITYKNDEYSNYQWILGTLFFEKYIVAFNKDDKVKYFYEKNTEQNDSGSDGGQETTYIIIIVVLSIVLIASVALFAYYIIKIKPRKKKANELDEDFDYQTKEDQKGGETPILND